VTTEDELRDGLRQQFGDPGSPSPGPAGPAPEPGAWSTIEARAAGRDDRRRAALWLGTAAVVLLVLFVGVGHLVGGGRSNLASTGTVPATSAPGSSLAASTTSSLAAGPSLVPTTISGLPPGTRAPVTTLGPSTTVPPPTSTPPTTTPPAGVVDCGTAYLASGWPTTVLPSPTLQQCILSTFAAGTPATYAERAQTDGEGGHIQVTTYLVTGVRQVRRTVDATGAQPPGGITVSVCTGLASGPDGQLAATGCSSA
jgi:hypothetical protein